MGSDALELGTVVEGRFQVDELLGQGGFGIVYRCSDHKRNDSCVLKEMFPPGSVREHDQSVRLPGDTSSARRLKRRFVEEGQIAARQNGPGIIPVRCSFMSNGTAYLVTDFVANASTLDQLLREASPIATDKALRLFSDLLATLDSLHESGILHRDIKPSNVLVAPKGNFLIDFGAAREWHADRTQGHTLTLTPEYAPPEQFAERARRGPPSDIFSLCATMFEAFAGKPPANALARAAGEPYVSVSHFRNDLPDSIAQAIDYGLRLKFAERPPNVITLVRVLEGDTQQELTEDVVEEFDRRAKRLREFHFSQRQCPSCLSGVLEHPRPLRAKQCPVCHAGQIRVRKIIANLCPHCRQAPLSKRSNAFPQGICPICSSAFLVNRKHGILKPTIKSECPDCESLFTPSPQGWTCESVRGKSTPNDERVSRSEIEWQQESGRALTIYVCNGCDAQYDLRNDGRWTQMSPYRASKYDTLFPEEWANVAAGLPPYSGNAECESCNADFFVEGDKATLLSFESDPFETGESLLGRLLDWESLRWLGIGKESPNDGFVCADCASEFDIDGRNLDLVKSNNLMLLDRADKTRTIEDWIRIGQRLPTVEEEHLFETDFDAAIREAFRTGQIGPDHPRRKDLIWSGPAEIVEVRDDEDGATLHSPLTITDTQITFGGFFRKTKMELSEFNSIRLEGDYLALETEGENLKLRIEPMEMDCSLESGTRKVVLEQEDLYARLCLSIYSS